MRRARIVRSARVPRDGAGRRPVAVSDKELERFRVKRMRSSPGQLSKARSAGEMRTPNWTHQMTTLG